MVILSNFYSIYSPPGFVKFTLVLREVFGYILSLKVTSVGVAVVTELDHVPIILSFLLFRNRTREKILSQTRLIRAANQAISQVEMIFLGSVGAS